MNIAQLSEQLKDVPQNRLVDYARNPNSVVPQFLALAEIQRRQHLQNTPQPPAATVAEDVLSQAAPQQMPQQMAPEQMAQQLPENQPGVAQLPTGMPQGMASGGIVAFAGGGMSDGYDNEDEYDLDERQANREESRIRTLIARMRARAGDAVAEVPRAFAAAVPTAIAGIPRAVESAASGIKSFASNLPKSYETEKAKPTSDITSFKSKGSHPYEEKAIAAAKEVGLDPRLMLHALYKETGGHRDPATAMSKAGAYGPMQLMEAAAKEVGVNRKDAYDNLLGGARYLKKQVDTFGDDTLALAAYNAGPGRVRQMLKRGQGIESLPPETQGYVKFSQGGIASFAGPYGSLVEDDEPTSTLGGLFSFLKQTPEQAIFAKNYLEDAQRKRAAQEALTDPELDVPFYKAIRPSERKSVETRRAEILRSLIPQTTAIDPKVKPAMTSDDVMRLANVNAVNHAQKKEGLDYSKVVPQYGNATDQEFRDFDQAAALYQAENQPKVVAEPTVPSRRSYAEEAYARINQDREDIKAQAGQDKYLALLQAGLGMMSGTSPYAMANIGQGGMQGVSAYAGAKKQRALERLALGKEELSVRRLEQLSDLEKAELAATMGLKQDDLQRKINAEVKRTEEKYSDNLEKFVTAISNRAAKNVPLKDMNGLPIEPEERIRLIQMEENRLFEQNKKILEDLAKRAKIQLPDFSAPPPKPTAPVKKEEPGIFSRLFGGNKQSSEAVDTSNKFLQ
jgi:soluble lytic murein transglycosylase-like protein/predicted DNA-binding protein (UPF0251 family)